MKKEANLYTFRVIIEPEKDGGYHGFVPILKGLHTFGDTISDVRNNLKEAIICHAQGILRGGEQIPKEEETLELIQTFSEKEFAPAR